MPARAARKLDLIIAALFLAGATLYAAGVRAVMDPRFFLAPDGNDVWFEADMPTVADLVLHRWSDHSRHAHHPLFGLFTLVPSYTLKELGASDAHRLAAVAVASAGIWSLATFVLLRLATPTRRDAIVFTLLAHVSAAAMFWLPTTETYVLGSMTLMVPLMVVAWDRAARLAEGWYVTASALSLAVTVSNWVAGIAAALLTRRAPRAVQITVNAFALVVVLWGVQRVLVPSVPFFMGGHRQSRFLFPEAAGGPVSVSRALTFHSIVMPRVDIVPEPKWGTRMSVQHSPLGSSGALGSIATAVWGLLLVTGLVSMWQTRRLCPLVPALALTAFAQWVVYLCYGEETFLYSLQMAPLLVSCAAVATWTSHRSWVTPLAVVLILLLAANNLPALSASLHFFSASIGSLP